MTPSESKIKMPAFIILGSITRLPVYDEMAKDIV